MVQAILAFFQTVISVQNISSVAAAQKAAQYQYFRDLSDQQINELVFALAARYPEYKYWEWYDIITTLKKYGALPEQKAQEPAPKPENNTAIWVAVGIAVAVIIFWGNR